MTSNIRLLSMSAETKMYEPSSSIHGSKQKVRCKQSLVHLVEFYLLFSRFHDCFKCEKPDTRGIWLTKTKDRYRMKCTDALCPIKKQSYQVNVTRDPAFLEPRLVLIMDKCFLHCSKLLSQMMEKIKTWYLISKRRAIYSDRSHKNMLKPKWCYRRNENRFKSALVLAEGCLVVARP
jgi:hypothetical protein